MMVQTATIGAWAVTTLQDRFRGALLWSDGSVLAGRAPGQDEHLSPLLTFPSGLRGTLCAS
jgi:hypothetical protein